MCPSDVRQESNTHSILGSPGSLNPCNSSKCPCLSEQGVRNLLSKSNSSQSRKKLSPFQHTAKVQHNSIAVTARSVPLVPAAARTLTQPAEPLFSYKIHHGHSKHFKSTTKLARKITVPQQLWVLHCRARERISYSKPAIQHSKRHTSDYRQTHSEEVQDLLKITLPQLPLGKSRDAGKAPSFKELNWQQVNCSQGTKCFTWPWDTAKTDKNPEQLPGAFVTTHTCSCSRGRSLITHLA